MLIRSRWPLAAAALAAILVGPSLGSPSLGGSSAFAQTDPMRLARLTAANQVGVMKYCQDKGWADQAAVDVQKQAAAALPASADPAGLQEAEATGRKGELMNNGTTLAMSAMARQGNTTEQDLCGRMVSAARMVASQRSAMPAMPGMPAMPNGVATPALPPGMTMPGMPKPQ